MAAGLPMPKCTYGLFQSRKDALRGGAIYRKWCKAASLHTGRKTTKMRQQFVTDPTKHTIICSTGHIRIPEVF